MFVLGLLQRRLQMRSFNYAVENVAQYSDHKKNRLPNLVLFGGGLGKLQGGMKEEEYFSSVNQGLIGKIHEHIDPKNVECMQNWDEYQKALNQSSLYNTASKNKHKNLMEEAWFMDETKECIRLLANRQEENNESESTESTSNSDAHETEECLH